MELTICRMHRRRKILKVGGGLKIMIVREVRAKISDHAHFRSNRTHF